MVRTRKSQSGAKPDPSPASLLRFRKTNQFLTDYQHAQAAGRHGAALAELWALLELLRKRAPLPSHYRCHPLSGPWKGWMDCHLEGDFVLIWRYERVGTEQVVDLAACGTHAYLCL